MLSLILLLILIPIFCMGVSVYIASLYDFICGSINMFSFASSMLIVIVIGYFLPRLFYKLYKSDTPRSLNSEVKTFNFSNYLIYIVLLLFGIALLIKFIISKESMLEIYMAAGIILLFVYITYSYFINFSTIEFTVKDIDKVNDKTKKLVLENKDCGYKILYVDNDSEFKKNEKYNFKFNKYSNTFKNNKVKVKKAKVKKEKTKKEKKNKEDKLKK